MKQLLCAWRFCRMHSSAFLICSKAKHSIPLYPISCLSMQTKIQGMKSPVSCAGLDRITIKGSKSREPIPFAPNRMSKCFSLCSRLWVLVNAAKWCCASSEDPKHGFQFMDVSANEKRTWKLWQRIAQEQESVGNEARIGNVCGALLVYLIRAECSQPLDRL